MNVTKRATIPMSMLTVATGTITIFYCGKARHGEVRGEANVGEME